MSNRHRPVLFLSVLFVVAACSATDPTVGDLRGRSFNSNDELITWLDCDGQWYGTTDGVEPGDLDWNSDKVVATAREYMGEGAHSPATDAVRAGRVWVLIGEDGRLIGGLEPGDNLNWCTG